MRPIICALLIGCFTAGASPASADDVADFYRGKRINLVIGYGSGGGYDTYARMLARFIGEHIPGNPTVIAQNMPGAGSRGAGNWLYNVAPKDGTVISMLSQATPTDQALGQPGIQFDVRKFNWIGNMVVVNNITFVWAATGVRSIDDAKQRVVVLGSTGASSPSVLYPQVSNNLFGTKFKIVSGLSRRRRHQHRGRARRGGRPRQRFLGLDESQQPGLDRERKVNILYQVGPRREPDLDAPLWSELAQNDEQRQILDVLSGDVAVGRPILTAPDVPAERQGAAASPSTRRSRTRNSSPPPSRRACISTRWAARSCNRSSAASSAPPPP